MPIFRSAGTMGIVCAILCELIFGFSFFFTKKTTGYADPIELLSWRFITGTIIFGVCRSDIVRRFSVRRFLPLLVLGVLFPGGYFLCEIGGIVRTTSSESGTVISLMPVMTMLLSALILKEKPTGLRIFAVFCSFNGITCCALAKGTQLSFDPLGYLLLLAGVLCFSLYSVLAKRFDAHFAIEEKTFFTIFSAAMIYTTIALIRSAAAGRTAEYLLLPFANTDFLLAVLYLGGACSCLAMFLCNFAINRIGSTRFSTFIGIETIVSITAGVVMLHESFSLLQGIGSVLVITGVYLANQR